ncbi:hypothetical protein GCM10028791_35210 [Echinicola sediminis]
MHEGHLRARGIIVRREEEIGYSEKNSASLKGLPTGSGFSEALLGGVLLFTPGVGGFSPFGQRL